MTHRLGTIGLTGISWFVIGVVSLHVLEPGFNPVTDYMSDYATGDTFGLLMNAAFFGAGVGTLAIGLGLRVALSPGKRVAATWVLLVVAGVAFIVVGLFNGDVTSATEMTLAGAIHVLGSMVLFISLLVAIWLLRGVFKRDPAWRAFVALQTTFAVALSVGFVATFVTPEGGPIGISQRLFVGVMMTWLLWLAWRLRTCGSRDTARPSRANQHAEVPGR